jgi:hypothetical protein
LSIKGGKKMLTKKITITVAIVALFVLLVSGTTYAVSPTQQAKAFAEKSFKTYSNTVKMTLVEGDYTSAANVEHAYLGDPITNYLINIDSFNPKESIKSQRQEMAFYVFPVIVGDEIVSDFTVALVKGEWEFIDIGGDTCKTLYQKAKESDISVNNCSFLRYGGQTFIVSEKDNEEHIWSYDNKNIAPENINNYMEKRQQQYLEFKIKGDKSIIHGTNFGAYAPISFYQNQSIWERLVNYIK